MTADLQQAAAALGDLTGQVAFLGGATVGLWFTDPAARPPRITFDVDVDVDVVVEVVTLGAYARFQAELRGRGFAEDVESGVIGRFLHAERGLVLDAVPMEPRLAGLRGRWLRPATEAAVSRTLPSGVVVRVVSPAWLTVTKPEAFADRGAGDCLGSRDFRTLCSSSTHAKSSPANSTRYRLPRGPTSETSSRASRSLRPSPTAWRAHCSAPTPPPARQR